MRFLSEYKYKDIAAAWEGVNDNGEYIMIQNTGDKDIVIKPTEKLFLNYNNFRKAPNQPKYKKVVKADGGDKQASPDF